MEIQATIIRDILYAASSYGGAYDTLCRLAGVTPEEISDSNRKLDPETGTLLWSLLADVTGDPRIGLRLGQEMNISMLGMVGFLMQSSQNLDQVIDVFTRYGYAISPLISYHYRWEANEAVLELKHHTMSQVDHPESARIRLDFNLSCTIHYLRTLSGRQIVPLRVTHEFGKDGVAAYQSTFGCTPVFDAATTRLVFRTADMELPVISQDRSLFDLFNGILAQQKEDLVTASCSQTLKKTLLMQFKGLIPTIEEVAQSMKMTMRTLQRKLLEEGTSFRQITNEVKKELALHLMRHKDTRLTEVAQVMGYSDLPAFRRAFKNWTRFTPKEMRQQMKLGNGDLRIS